jgi:hypothetical protein
VARQTFAGDLAAFTATTATVGGVADTLLLARSITGITAWTAKTGGTQVTDLQNTGGGAITTVSSDGTGLFEFLGPDEVYELWLDTGLGSRQYVGARLATKLIATAATAAAAVPSTLVDAKGDLLAGTADNAVARLAAGTNNTVLTADSTQASGMRWGARSGREAGPFSIGTVVVGTGTFRWYNNSGVTLTIVAVRTSVGTAPVGASLICDVNKDAVTIFTTQGNRPTITTGTFTSGKVTNMNVTTIADGSYLTVDIDQVGTTAAGANLDVQIELSV